MIKKLDHEKLDRAIEIQNVFQLSYKVEAALLNAKEFPPLKRSLTEFIGSKNDFYGFLIDDVLAAVIEIKSTKKVTHIQSLVVLPTFFRRGIAQNILDFTFTNFDTALFTVETGAANLPATALYKKNGFVEISQYNAQFDIRKVRFEKTIRTIKY